MTAKSVLSFFLLLVSLSTSGQITFGLGSENELLESYRRMTHFYDGASTSPEGFSIHTMILSIDPTELSKRDQRDVAKLKRAYSSFFQIEKEANKNKSLFVNGRLLEYQNEDVYFKLDPVLYFSIGKEKELNRTIFRNTRGLKLSGDISKKVFLRTALYENQSNYLDHIEQRIIRRSAIPGQGFYKRYESDVFNGIKGWDYLNAEGVITYRPSDKFKASIGHGSFFIGSGYQSLLLSDYADNYFFVEFNTSIGIFNYQNIFAELAPIGSTINTLGDPLAPKKYMATHILTVAPHKNLKFSFFESVIFGRENNFELQYLNPIILYRVVEQKLDSPDNVLLGLDFNYKIKKKSLVYGQLLIDEMRIGELVKNSGWWGNKVGYQLGLRHYGLFKVDHLDVLIEYNVVRPYTYSHRKMSENDEYVVSSYTHYNQELAHPLGANFREWIGEISYVISNKWQIKSKVQWAQTGLSTPTNNAGNDVVINNDTRGQEYKNEIGQGDKTTIWQVGSTLTYDIGAGYYSDLQMLYRDQSSISGHNDVKSTYFALSFRANIGHKKLDY